MSTSEPGEPSVSARAARERAVSRVTAQERARRNRESWDGEQAAIYCRISHIKDKDQTSVERQERICREIVASLGLALGPGRVFIDPNRSAWKRDRKRPGWDALIGLARDRGIRHIVVYHPDRLMRQPWDLEELLKIADDHGIILHGKSGNRDLSDPDDRHYLRGEVAHACRSSDDTSRRVREAMVDRARDGKPHPGRRYGYGPNAIDIIEHEAEIVRWVFESFLHGMTPYAIADDLNRRGEPTAFGRRWSIPSVLRLLDSRHVAGIRVFRGEEIGRGNWPAIIDEAMFREVQERRTYRSAVSREQYEARQFYLLRGLLWCAKCGVRMSGRPTGTGGGPVYVCNNFRPETEGEKCYRRAGATTLDAFVKDAAIDLLERLDVSGLSCTGLVPWPVDRG